MKLSNINKFVTNVIDESNSNLLFTNFNQIYHRTHNLIKFVTNVIDESYYN